MRAKKKTDRKKEIEIGWYVWIIYMYAKNKTKQKTNYTSQHYPIVNKFFNLIRIVYLDQFRFL